jgi:hypothetical protein
MRVFVLNTGRCGSLTFTRACQASISNYTAAHESRSGVANLVDRYGELLRHDPARYANHCNVVGVRAVRLRQLALAREYFLKAVLVDPRRLRNWGRLAASYVSPVAKRLWR